MRNDHRILSSINKNMNKKTYRAIDKNILLLLTKMIKNWKGGKKDEN
jgi:hypothetical protein